LIAENKLMMSCLWNGVSYRCLAVCL